METEDSPHPLPVQSNGMNEKLPSEDTTVTPQRIGEDRWCLVCGKMLKDWDNRCPNMFFTTLQFGKKMSISLSLSDAIQKNLKPAEVPTKALCCKCCLQLEETSRIEERLREIREDILSSYNSTQKLFTSGKINEIWSIGASADDDLRPESPSEDPLSDIKIVETRSLNENAFANNSTVKIVEGRSNSGGSTSPPFKIRIMDPASINKSVPTAPKVVNPPGPPLGFLRIAPKCHVKIVQPVKRLYNVDSLKQVTQPANNIYHVDNLKHPAQAKIIKLSPWDTQYKRAAILKNNVKITVRTSDVSTVWTESGVVNTTPSPFLPRSLVAGGGTSSKQQTSLSEVDLLCEENLEVQPDVDFYSEPEVPMKRTYQIVSPTNFKKIKTEEANEKEDFLCANTPPKQKRKSTHVVREDNLNEEREESRRRKLKGQKPKKKEEDELRRIKRWTRAAEKVRPMDIHTMLENVSGEADPEEIANEVDLPMKRGAFRKASKRLQIIAKYDKTKVLKKVEELVAQDEKDNCSSKNKKSRKSKSSVRDDSPSADCESSFDAGASCDSSEESPNIQRRSRRGKSDVDSVCNQISKVILESPPQRNIKKSPRFSKRPTRSSEVFVCDICKLDYWKLDDLRDHIEQDHFAPTY